jgi:hypothetical protein
MKFLAVTLALLTPLVAAKTDLDGCTSFTSTVTVHTEIGFGNTYETVIWYVPDTLELCRGVDCGGGMAPPKSVPGCPLYSGTETVTPSFLPSDPAAPVVRSTSTTAVTTTTTTAATGAEETGGSGKEEDGDEKGETGSVTSDQAPSLTRRPSTELTTPAETPSSTSTNTDAPGAAAAHPSAAGLAVNLIAGVAAFMALM